MLEKKDESIDLEPDPSDFEEDDSLKDKKPSYLEGKITSNSVVISFFFICLCFWVSSTYWASHKTLEYFIMEKDLESTSLFYKALMSVLAHGDLKHYLSNAGLLFIFGILLHNYYGFLIFPCLSLLTACLAHIVTIYLYNDPSVRLLGASSMVYSMAALWLFWYFRYEQKKNKVQKILRVLAFIFVVLLPSQFSPQTSYLGHFIGFILGLFSAIIMIPFMDQKIAIKESTDT